MHKEFEVHKLSDQGFKDIGSIADAYNVLLDSILKSYPEGYKSREMSIVRTKLEEACFYTKKNFAIEDVKNAKSE